MNDITLCKDGNIYSFVMPMIFNTFLCRQYLFGYVYFPGCFQNRVGHSVEKDKELKSPNPEQTILLSYVMQWIITMFRTFLYVV